MALTFFLLEIQWAKISSIFLKTKNSLDIILGERCVKFRKVEPKINQASQKYFRADAYHVEVLNWLKIVVKWDLESWEEAA
jgi:hypothetical protein